MTTIILTVVITVIAYQLIIFIISLANLYDNEKIQYALCGVWALFTFIIIRPVVKLYRIYRKCQLHWFNTHYTKCVFYTKREGKTAYSTIFYVKNTEIDKLSQDENRTNYIKLKPEEKAKSLLDMNIKRNRGSGYLTDLSNPPIHSGYTSDHIAKWLK